MSQPALWTPTQLGADVVNWVDHSSGDVAYTANSCNDFQFPNTPGGAAIYTPNSSSTTGHTTLNGLTALLMGGSSRGYYEYHSSNVVGPLTELHVIGVASIGTAGGGYGRIASYTSSAGGQTDYTRTDSFNIARQNGTSSWGFDFGGLQVEGNSGYNNAFIWEAELYTPAGGTTLKSTWHNGTPLKVQVDTGKTAAVTWREIDEGCRPGANDIGSGIRAERITIRRALTQDETSKLQGYLAWKWGLQDQLPANHPYAAAAPTVANTGSVASTAQSSVYAYGRLVQHGSSTATASSSVRVAQSDNVALGAASSTSMSRASVTGRLIAKGASSSSCASIAATRAGRGQLASSASMASSSSVSSARAAVHARSTAAAAATALASGHAVLRSSSSAQAQSYAFEAGNIAPALRIGTASAAARASVTISAIIILHGSMAAAAHTSVAAHALMTASGSSAAQAKATVAIAAPRLAYGSQSNAQARANVVANAKATYRVHVGTAPQSTVTAYLVPTVAPRKVRQRALISTPLGANRHLASVVNQVNDLMRTGTATAPTSPTLLYTVNRAADLPAASDYQYGQAWVIAINRMVVSNGTNWLRTDTGASVA